MVLAVDFYGCAEVIWWEENRIRVIDKGSGLGIGTLLGAGRAEVSRRVRARAPRCGQS